MRVSNFVVILFIYFLAFVCASDPNTFRKVRLKPQPELDFNQQSNSIHNAISSLDDNSQITIRSSYVKNPYSLHHSMRNLITPHLPSLVCSDVQPISSSIAKGSAYVLSLSPFQLENSQCNTILNQALSWQPCEQSQTFPAISLCIYNDTMLTDCNGGKHEQATKAFEYRRKENSQKIHYATYQKKERNSTCDSVFIMDVVMATNSTFFMYVDSIPSRNFSEISYNFVYESNKELYDSVIVERDEMLSIVSQGHPTDSLENVTLNNNLPVNFTTMTYNIWNFNRGHNWEIRVVLIANIINLTNPDILAVQELRDDWDDKLPNQIDDLTRLLPQYKYWKYTPAQVWANSEEGIGILSKYPFIVDNVHYLPLAGDKDHNQRVLVKTSMKHKYGMVDVFSTHWSFDGFAQMNQSLECINIMRNYTGAIQLLMGILCFGGKINWEGDFNIYINYEEPATALINEGGFYDSWATKYNVSQGLTFSTLPTLGLYHRADRIFFKPTRKVVVMKVKHAQLYGGNATENNIYPSDHYGLFVSFEVGFSQLAEISANEAAIEEWILNVMLGSGVSGLTLLALMMCLWSQRSLLWESDVELPKPV